MSKTFLTDALSVVPNRELRDMFVPALALEMSAEKLGWGRSPVIDQSLWNGAVVVSLSHNLSRF